MPDKKALSQQPDMQAIINRLIRARENAGLSRSQAAKLYGGDMDLFLWWIEAEGGWVHLHVEELLKLCQIYDVDVTWVLTGVNPAFDPQTVIQGIQDSNMSADEAGDLLEMLASLRQGK